MKTIVRVFGNIGMTIDGENLRVLRRFSTTYSEICIVEIREKNDSARRYVVKLCKTKSASEVTREFENLTIFNRKFCDERIAVPEPIGIDTETRAIIMEYVDGNELKRLLLGLRSMSRERLEKLMRLSGIGLSRFHRMETTNNGGSLCIRSPYLDSNINLEEIRTIADKCNLRCMIKSFIDFSAWNIIIPGESDDRLVLIDFPSNETTSTPHIDLARFRYSLKILKQYPQARIAGISWWTVEDTFGLFVDEYLRDAGTTFNDSDWRLIDWFEREYFRRLMSVYETRRPSFRLALERIYMSAFVQDAVAENNGPDRRK